MPSLNPDVFQSIANRFMAADMASIADHFCYPTAVYLKNDTLVYQSKDELSRSLIAYHDLLIQFGFKTTRVRVDALSLARGRTQSVWVNWQHLTANGTLIEESHIRYLGILKPSREFQIQLSEYLVAPSICSLDSNLFVA